MTVKPAAGTFSLFRVTSTVVANLLERLGQLELIDGLRPALEQVAHRLGGGGMLAAIDDDRQRIGVEAATIRAAYTLLLKSTGIDATPVLSAHDIPARAFDAFAPPARAVEGVRAELLAMLTEFSAEPPRRTRAAGAAGRSARRSPASSSPETRLHG